MKFRNYCVVIMGETSGVVPEIHNISEVKPNVLDAKGIVIATFNSFMEPKELSEWFKSNNRSFLIFDLNEENSGFNITRKDIHEGLFGFLRQYDNDALDSNTIDFLNTIKTINSGGKNSNETTAYTETTAVSIEMTESDIDSMTKTEKKELYDKIIDKGVKNLTDYDKKLLSFLVK